MKTQLAICREHLEAGRTTKALRLAARWPNLGPHRAVITRAASALTSPGLYRDMGYDPDKLVEEGIAALKEWVK